MIKTEGLVKNQICIYETYKNKVMPHGRHIYDKSSYMAQDTMCTYPQSDHAFLQCKFVLRCCDDCPCITLTDQETYNHYSDTTPPIRFNTYHIIASCTAHGRTTSKDKNICCKCKQESSTDKSTKIYTRKEIVMMQTTMYYFNTGEYIPSIKRLDFHLPLVRILGTNHCGALQCTAFKCCKLFQDVLCRRYYDERTVVSVSHQIQPECYGRNISVSIEGIALEQRRTSIQLHHNVNLTQCFTIFLFDDSKQDAATTTTHSKSLITLFK